MLEMPGNFTLAKFICCRFFDVTPRVDTIPLKESCFGPEIYHFISIIEYNFLSEILLDISSYDFFQFLVYYYYHIS